MHENSRVVIRFLGILRSSNNEKSSNNGIVLWCRRYNVESKTFDPYVCMGRVSYEQHDATVQPIKFVLNLLDFDDLMSTHKVNAQDMFAL